MADLRPEGHIIACCWGCDGAKSTFVWQDDGVELGVVVRQYSWPKTSGRAAGEVDIHYRLFRCAGCGSGAIGAVYMKKTFAQYPRDTSRLAWFMPEAKNALALPAGVPGGIATEFREAEHCLGVGASRAAAVMFRSVLDKTFRHNGYKKGGLRSLNDQIDAAVTDGVITEARRQRAHEDVRVLGNDVLHDEWRPLEAADVEPAHHYTQRILEDFYADREVVLEQLRAKGRVPEEDVGGSGE